MQEEYNRQYEHYCQSENGPEGKTYDGYNNHGYGAPPMSKPNSHLAWAIVSAIFCFWPFSIPSIVYAAQVDRLWYAGRYYEACNAASKARSWFWWSFVIGLFIFIAYLLYYFIIILGYSAVFIAIASLFDSTN